MIEELKQITNSEVFKHWLNSPHMWNTLDIDYHPPRVERLWRNFDELRIFLHVIHPCTTEEALMHPHPWESAIRVLPIGGQYEHGIGYRIIHDTHSIPSEDIVCKQIITGEMYYEMMSPNGIHYVRPIGVPSYSIMITGPKIWEDNGTEVTKELGPLSEERKIEILQTFKTYFE